MNLYFFVFSLFIAATITLTLALRSWHRGASQAMYFSLLLGSLSLGTVSYAMELWGMDETGKYIWLFTKYVGLISTPVFWFLFALQYTERKEWIRWPYILSLSVVPVLTMIMLMTVNQNHWIFQTIQLREGQVFFEIEYGPYFWVQALYSFSLIVLGCGFLLHWLQKNHILRTSQWIGLISGVCLPFVVNLMTLFNFPADFLFDLTPLAMTLGILIIGWALFGLNFSGVNPIARESLIESLKDGVIVIDTHRIITDINPAALYLVSVKQSPLGHPIQAVIPDAITLPTLKNDDTYPHQEITVPETDGHLRVLDLRASPLVDRTRLLRGWLLLLRDITEQKRLQDELKKQSLRNAALAEIELAINQPHELVGVLKKIVDTTHELLPAPGGATILMWNEDTRTFEHADSTLPTKALSKMVARAKQGLGSAPWIIHNKQPKIVLNTQDDPFGDQELLISNNILSYVGFPLIANGTIVGIFYANDVQPRVYSQDDLQFLQTLSNRAANAIYRVLQFSQIQQHAIMDHLTGIYNRRQLFNLGELELKRARRFKRPLSTIMIDIDHFKNINDTYGHAKGDQVLRALAQLLKMHLRDFDILGRYGGEEFVIVLPGADLSNARNVAYRLRKGVQDRPMINGSVSITISLGVAELSNEISDLQTLMNKADMAMYDAKRAGRNQVAWAE